MVTVELRPPNGGLPSGVVVPLYQVCRTHHGEPLATLAAMRLAAAVTPGDTVLVATGAGRPPALPNGETDGPLGAMVLGRALTLALGANIVFVCEERFRPPLDAVAATIVERLSDATFGFEPFTEGYEAGLAAAQRIVAVHRPAAVVCVERDGPNKEGHFHGVRGDCRPPEGAGHVHLLIEEARRSGALTVGIGDGGNEIGFGAIRDRVAEVLPGGGICLSGCASGVATVADTDVVVAASVSNWAAYAIAAGLATLCRDPGVLHPPGLERQLLHACVAGGARDGATGRPELAVDGIAARGQTAVVTLLTCAVAAAMQATDRPYDAAATGMDDV